MNCIKGITSVIRQYEFRVLTYLICKDNLQNLTAQQLLRLMNEHDIFDTEYESFFIEDQSDVFEFVDLFSISESVLAFITESGSPTVPLDQRLLPTPLTYLFLVPVNS